LTDDILLSLTVPIIYILMVKLTGRPSMTQEWISVLVSLCITALVIPQDCVSCR